MEDRAFYLSCRPSHKPTKRIIRVICTIPVFAQTVTYHVKGRTIRKVMGGGGEFSSRRNFFSLSDSLYEFFLGHSMNIF